MLKVRPAAFITMNVIAIVHGTTIAAISADIGLIVKARTTSADENLGRAEWRRARC